MERALAAWLLLAFAPAPAPTPTDVVQSAIEETVRVIQDADPAKPEAPRRRIRQIAEDLFDFQEMARRSLAQHWAERTARQREEFTGLLTALLERAYFGRIQSYSGEKIIFTGESVDGNFASVRSKLITNRKTKVPLEYRMHRVGSRWAVYDFVVDGVSFVSTHRAQFRSILQQSTWEELLERLRQKATPEAELTGAPREVILRKPN